MNIGKWYLAGLLNEFVDIGTWWLVGLGIIALGLLTWICVKPIIDEGGFYGKNVKQLQNQPIQKPKATFLQAKVLGKRIHIHYVNIKLSKSETEYWVNFLLENGEEREYYVSKEIFDKVEEGQESTLVLLNGMFFDFGEGEDIEDFEDNTVD